MSSCLFSTLKCKDQVVSFFFPLYDVHLCSCLILLPVIDYWLYLYACDCGRLCLLELQTIFKIPLLIILLFIKSSPPSSSCVSVALQANELFSSFPAVMTLWWIQSHSFLSSSIHFLSWSIFLLQSKEHALKKIVLLTKTKVTLFSFHGSLIIIQQTAQ